MFVRGRHVAILAQLAGLSEEMTPWMWARWAAYQCTRSEDLQHRSGRLQRVALDYVVRMFYADRLEHAYTAGEDPIQLLATVAGESWLFHQLCTHDLCGLQVFMSELATGRLASENGFVQSWTGAPMGGYRLKRPLDGSLVVHDLGSDRDLTLLNLGACVLADEDGWLIGRVVPTGTTPALMFDTRPVAVDETTARAVAQDPTPRGWVTAVVEALDEGRLDRARFESEDLEIATDVPSLALVKMGTPPAALASTLTQLARGRDEIGRSAYRILCRVAEGRFGPDHLAPYVAAAVLNAHAYAELRARPSTGAAVDAWKYWADLVPEPAKGRFQRLGRQRAA